MTDDDLPEAGGEALPAVLYTAERGRAICGRLASGESQVSICADPAMPSRGTLFRWMRDMPPFAEAVAKARAAAGRTARGGHASSYCPTTANEIFDRMCAGESVTRICADPAMPSFSTFYYWRKHFADFREAMRVAREVQAERFCDLGWEIAEAVRPETAQATRVKLNQLRWTASVLCPGRYGRLKPGQAPAAPRERSILFRHFQVETHPDTGQRRVVGYTPDPSSMTPVCDAEGPWTRLPEVADLSAEGRAARAAQIARMAAEADAGDEDEDED
jgi:hypothetical protein